MLSFHNGFKKGGGGGGGGSIIIRYSGNLITKKQVTEPNYYINHYNNK